MSPQRHLPAPSATGGSGRRGPAEYRRRSVLVAGVGALVAPMGGCTRLVDFLTGFVLDDVNVLNEAGEPVGGTVTVADPTDAVALEDAFDLVPTDAGPNAQAIYDGVWTGPGEYEVTVELDERLEGQSRATASVTVADPTEEHLVIGLGNDGVPGGIGFHVIERFSDLADEFE